MIAYLAFVVKKCDIYQILIHVLSHILLYTGWKSTYDSCYASFAKPTLSQVVIQLTNNPKLRFVWSEIVFLERWWTEASAQQKIDMKRYYC